MPALATVLYQKSEDAKFDMKYYLSTHMELVDKHWGPLGLTSWSITELDSSCDYIVQASLWWDDIEKLKAAVASPTAALVMGDIENFTNIKPLIVFGKEAAKSK